MKLTEAQRGKIIRQHAELPRSNSGRIATGGFRELARHWGLSASGLRRIVEDGRRTKQ